MSWTNGTSASFRTSLAIGIEAGSAGALCWSSAASASAGCDTGTSRLAADSVAAGNGNQGDKTGLFTAKRFFVDGATSLVAGDFVLSAGWGTTASIAAANGTSKDAAALMTVTSSGTGQAANPTIQFTFHDGAWTQTPVCLVIQAGGNDVFGDTTLSGVLNTTVGTWIWNATPTATKTYQFLIQCTGT
jgi:hypothetical protein